MDGAFSLVQELQKPTHRITVQADGLARPMRVRLLHSDGTQLIIYSTMHDVAARLEVGVLQFEFASAGTSTGIPFELPAAFGTTLRALKMAIADSWGSAESGVVLSAVGGESLVVCAGAAPYMLAVRWPGSPPEFFYPEYEYDSYAQREF